MKKKIILLAFITIFLVLILFGGYKLYQYIRIKTAKVEITLKDNRQVEFNTKVKVSDFVTKINGHITNDYQIDTTKLGKQQINFKWVNDDKIKLTYEYELEVIDTAPPVVWLNNSYSVEKNSDIDLTKKILCGDNADNQPNCIIEGSYDLATVGNYPLVFKATDASGNETVKNFTLKVYEPTNNNDSIVPSEVNYLDFTEVFNTYKSPQTKIGLDISKWQQDVDFNALKNAGVEFVMLRLGGTTKENKFFVDEKFKQNIIAANQVGIDVGIYFYSHANSVKQAKKEASWVLKQIKNYKVTLPIAFDWEEWSNFNEYHLSFFGLTNLAEEFVKTVEKKGYQGMIYSSKNYLEQIWLPTNYDIWLAHYITNTTYTGHYKMWQRTDKGKVAGINGAVDIDIMYA